MGVIQGLLAGGETLLFLGTPILNPHHFDAHAYMKEYIATDSICGHMILYSVVLV